MPIAPADLLAVADYLRKGAVVPSGEPRDRTVLGRLYYSAFLAVREAVRVNYDNKGFEVRHENLRDSLKGSLEPEVAEVGERLSQLLQWRKRSDYKIEFALQPYIVGLMHSNAIAIHSAIPKITPKIPKGIPALW